MSWCLHQWGFPLNHGPWSPHNNPLGKGGPARGPWQDFEDDVTISQEELEEMEVDFQELDSDGDFQEDEEDEDDEPHEWSKMPRLGQVGRTVVLWSRNLQGYGTVVSHEFTRCPAFGRAGLVEPDTQKKRCVPSGGVWVSGRKLWVEVEAMIFRLANFCGLNLGYLISWSCNV